MSDLSKHIVIFMDDDCVYIDSEMDTRRIVNDNLKQELIGIVERSKFESDPTTDFFMTATARATLAEASDLTPVELPYRSRDYHFNGKRIELADVSNDLPSVSISEVIRNRRSRREFGPINFSSLSNLLFHGARVRDVWQAPDGFKAASKAAPSAGARHPIDLFCVVNEVQGLEQGFYFFDAFHCVLMKISNSAEVVEELTIEAFSRLGQIDIPPVLVYFVAQLHRTLSRYPHGITFVYRDSGAMLTTLSLVATALGLHSCGIGTSGQAIINELLNVPFPNILEVGGIAVGGRGAKD